MLASLLSSPRCMLLIVAAICGLAGLIHGATPHYGTLATHHHVLQWATTALTNGMGVPTTLWADNNTLPWALTPIWQWPTYPVPIASGWRTTLWVALLFHGLWQWGQLLQAASTPPHRRHSGGLAPGTLATIAVMAICPGFLLPLSLPGLLPMTLFWLVSSFIAVLQNTVRTTPLTGTPKQQKHPWPWHTPLLLAILATGLLWQGGVLLGLACLGFGLLGHLALLIKKPTTPKARNRQPSQPLLGKLTLISSTLLWWASLMVLLPITLYIVATPALVTTQGLPYLTTGVIALLKAHGWHYWLAGHQIAVSLGHTIAQWDWNVAAKTLLWSLWAAGPLWVLALVLAVCPAPQHTRRQPLTLQQLFAQTAWAVWLLLAAALLPALPWPALLPPMALCARLAHRLTLTTPQNAFTNRLIDIALFSGLLGSIVWLFTLFYALGDVFPGSQWRGPGTAMWDPFPLLIPIPLAVWQWWLVPISMGLLALAGLLYWLYSRTTLLPKLAGLWACGVFMWLCWYGSVVPTFSRSNPIPGAPTHLNPAVTSHTIIHRVSTALALQTLPDIAPLLSQQPHPHPAGLRLTPQWALITENAYFALPATQRQQQHVIHQWQPWPLAALPLGTQWGVFPIPFWQHAINPHATPRARVLLTHTR